MPSDRDTEIDRHSRRLWERLATALQRERGVDQRPPCGAIVNAFAIYGALRADGFTEEEALDGAARRLVSHVMGCDEEAGRAPGGHGGGHGTRRGGGRMRH